MRDSHTLRNDMSTNDNIIALTQPEPKSRVSVIMVTFWTGPALFEAVTAVLNDPDVFELIIVDNGNPEAARASLSEYISRHQNVRLLQGHGNIGFAKACNYGANIATGECFLFLNPDAVIAQGAARKLAECGQNLNRPWLVGGMIRGITGAEQRGSRRGRLTPLSAFLTFTGLSRFIRASSIHQEHLPLPLEPSPMAVVSGAFMMTDRQSFQTLGGFDEKYFLHVEDIDICERVRKLDGDVYFQSSATAMHYGSTSKVNRLKIEWEKQKGFIRYFWKHYDRFWQRLILVPCVPFMTAAIMLRAYWLGLKSGFSNQRP